MPERQQKKHEVPETKEEWSYEEQVCKKPSGVGSGTGLPGLL
jgi:hypothetical protein